MDFSFSIYDSYRSFMIIIPNSSFQMYFDSPDYEGFRFTNDVCLEFQCSQLSSDSVGVDLYISVISEESAAITKYYWQSFNVAFDEDVSLDSENFSSRIVDELFESISADLFTYVLAVIQTELEFSEFKAAVDEYEE